MPKQWSGPGSVRCDVCGNNGAGRSYFTCDRCGRMRCSRCGGYGIDTQGCKYGSFR